MSDQYNDCNQCGRCETKSNDHENETLYIPKPRFLACNSAALSNVLPKDIQLHLLAKSVLNGSTFMLNVCFLLFSI